MKLLFKIFLLFLLLLCLYHFVNYTQNDFMVNNIIDGYIEDKELKEEINEYLNEYDVKEILKEYDVFKVLKEHDIQELTSYDVDELKELAKEYKK